MVEVTEAVFADLLSLAKRHPLRGFDAIHLCTALWFGKRIKAAVTFVAADHNLLEAAEAEGFDIDNPEQHGESE